MISPYRVTYNSFSSEDFDLICDVAFDSDSGATSSFLSREAVASETYRGDIKYVSSYKYTESFAPVITFVDKNFGDFTMERQRQILKWITSKDIPSFLNVYHDDSNVVSYAILGAFTECETYKLSNGRVIGFQCTFESIMPYALSDLYVVTKTITSPTDNKITIDIDTDDNKPIYPSVTIKHNGINYVRIADGKILTTQSKMADNTAYFNGSIFYWRPSTAQLRTSTTKPTTDYNKAWNTKTVTQIPSMNAMDDNTFYLYNGTYYWIDPPYTFRESPTNPALETTSAKLVNTHTDLFDTVATLDPVVVQNNTLTEQVVLDGANKIVSSSNTNRIFGDDFVDWRWLELYDCKNEIVIEGNCEVTLKYREVRKIGEF